MSPRILQVCNVGQITGGTAACAWTLTRAFPEAAHTVLFRSRISADTRQAFAGCTIHSTTDPVQSLPNVVRDVRPHLLVLHNQARGLAAIPHTVPGEPCQPLILQYMHSAITPAAAHRTVCCSGWLARRCGLPASAVLLQGVPRPPKPANRTERDASARTTRQRELVVGRLCTPARRKWPEDLPEFYSRLARQAPHVRWEFVGCPPDLQPALAAACRQRVRFHDAGRDARSHLWRWDTLLYHHSALTESFGRTVAEAMRCGCIPVVDDRGGFREQIVPGTGFLCPGPDDFTAALHSMAAPAARQSLSRAARLHAEQRFSIAAFRQRLLTIVGHNLAGVPRVARPESRRA